MTTVNDLIKILDTKENRYGATGKPRMMNLSLNGNFAGSIEEAKLDGYGDGLIASVTLEITSFKPITTNADRIRNMSDEELAEFLCKVQLENQRIERDFPRWLDWLQLEAR